jgi:fatty acid desaturase
MSTSILPTALLGSRASLSPHLRQAIRDLSGPRPGYFLTQLALAWLVIAGSIFWAAYAQNPWISALVVVIVATRQNILGLLVHEQAHCLGFKPRFGDPFVNLVAAYPLLLLTVEGYAKVHLTHHKYFFTERDPDHLRKSGDDWILPMRPGKLAGLFLRDLLGLNVLKLLKGKRQAGPAPVEFGRRAPVWLRPLFFVVLATCLTLTASWGGFLLYWVLPLLTVFQVIVRWGALAEHQYNLPDASVAESTPVILPSRLDRLLLPNLNFSLHAYHHDFPGVSAGQLRQLHALYVNAGLVNEAAVFHGNFDYLRHISGYRIQTETAAQPSDPQTLSGNTQGYA